MEKKSLDSLLESWQNSPFPSLKVSSYFSVYNRLFKHLIDKNCVFIETGVLDGGSLFMWRNWLGPKARIIGVDLNPEALKWKDAGFEIFVGDQGDPNFWDDIFTKIGQFDVLLDDGGHQSFQQIVTVASAIRNAKTECIIVVEDTHTSFMKSFSSHGERSFIKYAKDATDIINARSFSLFKNQFPKLRNMESLQEFHRVQSIEFFNGIVAFYITQLPEEHISVVRNKPREKATDFRYEGKANAIVRWPDMNIKNSLVRVRGGQKLNARACQIFCVNGVEGHY